MHDSKSFPPLQEKADNQGLMTTLALDNHFFGVPKYFYLAGLVIDEWHLHLRHEEL